MKKRTWNVDTNLKIVIGGTEIGVVAVTGKVEYVPSETEGKNCKVTSAELLRLTQEQG